MNNPRAFPQLNATTNHSDALAGMTLRDYFAAKAMQAMVSEGSYAEGDTKLAAFAYEMADAMLKEREKTQ